MITDQQRVFLALCHLVTHVNNKNETYATSINIPPDYNLVLMQKSSDLFIVAHRPDSPPAPIHSISIQSQNIVDVDTANVQKPSRHAARATKKRQVVVDDDDE